MAKDYTFSCVWDSKLGWQISGDSRHTGYWIDAKHTADGEQKYVTKEYNDENYLRTPTELDVMGRMHTAYRAADKKQLQALVKIAEKTFDGKKRVVKLYKYAAGKL